MTLRLSLRLAQACVELLKRRLTGAKLLFVERVQGCVHRAQVCVQVFRILLDIEQAGDNLAFGGVMLQEAEGRVRSCTS